MGWEIVSCTDPTARALADRHYTRRSVGSARFVGPGRPLVLLHVAEDGTPDAVWAVLDQDPRYVDHAWPGWWNNSLFRTESAEVPASQLVRGAVAAMLESWGPPPLGLLTFVNPQRSPAPSVPGYCYRRAGWRRLGSTPGGHGRPSLVVLRAPRSPRKVPP